MDKKKDFAARMEAFFAGKGFYIVLLLCVAVIGVSAWSMLSAGGGAEEDAGLPVSSVESGEFTDTLKTQPPAAATPAPATPPPATATVAPEPEPEPETPSPVPETKPEPEPAEAPAVDIPAVEVQDYYIWPVTGAVETDYSMAALVYDVTMRDWRTHDGLDLAADKGAQVRAAANGRVTEVYNDDRYGTTVVIEHANGLTSTYASLAETPTVAVGDQVGVGEVIGAVGDTALCEIGAASHLHFAMARDGESVDPKEYMP